MLVKQVLLSYLFDVFLCTSGSCDPMTFASKSLSFSASDRIDLSGAANRDPTKPFFFSMTTGQGASYPFTVDIGSDFDVDLRSKNAPGAEADRSLAITLQSDIAKNVKDKIMLDFVKHKGAEALEINGMTDRFLSFDMMLDGSYPVSRYWVIHLQVWQCCGGHPPLLMQVKPNSDPDSKIVMQLEAYNDPVEIQNYGHAPMILAEFGVERGRWTHYALALKPKSCAAGPRDGHIELRVDHMRVVDWHGCWGYEPSEHSQATRGRVRSELGIDLGIYRRREPLRQTIYLDNLKYGSRREEVD